MRVLLIVLRTHFINTQSEGTPRHVGKDKAPTGACTYQGCPHNPRI